MVKPDEIIDPAWVAGFADHLAEELGPCPRSGGGVHRYIFRAAIWLRNVCTKEIAQQVISRGVASCGREVPQREIQQAIEIAHQTEPKEIQAKWPRKDQMRINQIALKGPRLVELQCCSPVLPSTLTPRQLIDKLFPGDPNRVLLCMGNALDRAETRPKGYWYGALDRMQFIVPNTMKAIKGNTKLNARYFRTLDNTGPRRFLVIECDPMAWDELAAEAKAMFGTEWDYKRIKRDECAAVLWHLGQMAPRFPLVMVVDSAGKSLHAWVLVEGAEEGEVRDFFRHAVALGADPMTWTPCQFVRMPAGLRDTGRRQQVVYFNPQPLELK